MNTELSHLTLSHAILIVLEVIALMGGLLIGAVSSYLYGRYHRLDKLVLIISSILQTYSLVKLCENIFGPEHYLINCIFSLLSWLTWIFVWNTIGELPIS